MNKELFRSMQEQMRPSAEARDALTQKLASAKKKTVPVGRYVAIAACAAALVAAVPVIGSQLKWQAILDNFQTDVLWGSFHKNAVVEITQPHSYELADSTSCWPEDTVTTESSIDTGGAGDRDQDMTSGELTDNMLEAGFTQDDVDAYLASGWQMTWANWWKFCHQSEETGERTLEALLDFSQEERLAVNTGEADVPSGAYVDQGEAIMAYQNLMDRFKADYGPDTYPEWYGGAYIDEHAGLIVNIAAGYEPEDKELFCQIHDWAGSDKVGFGTSCESLNYLRFLQAAVLDAMEEMGLSVGCGINEETGMVELTLPEVNEEALWKLAYLDPTNSIHVVVARTAATDIPAEEPVQTAPSVSHVIQPGGDNPNTPVSNQDGIITDEDGVIAYEPQG